jgi:predicted permease
MSWMSRFTNVLRLRRVDRDLDDEQRFHLESRIEDLMRDGLTREQAAARAARQFGGRLRTRESSRDVKLLPWLDSLARDARHGVRLLRRDATVTTAAVVSLALAIGACTAAFSLIDALMLRTLPVRDPASLVYLTRDTSETDIRIATLLSHPHLQRFRAAAPSQVEIFSMSHQSLRQAILPDSGGAEEKLRLQFVSGNAMTVLGVGTALGRILQPSDDVTRSAHQVAVISHAFWSRRFAADPRAVGRWMEIEQQPFQIVGVAERGFTGSEPGVLTDVWAPNMMWGRGQDLSNSDWNWLRVWGRLAPGVDREAIVPIVNTTYTNLEREKQSARQSPAPATRRAERLAVRPAATGVSGLRERFARPLVILAALVGIVLLIACSNLANLLLARGAARDREMMLRASIGASRARLLQQVLVEASILTAAATLVGIVFARAAVPLIVGMITMSDNPVYLDTTIDLRVVAFVTALGSLTTLVFALAPAMRASAAPPHGALAQSGPRHTSQSVLLRPLVALQIGFSLMVLFVAGLLLQSFDRLTRVDLGFAPDGVALVTIEAREPLAPDVNRAAGRQLLEEVRRLPGVEAASLSGWGFFKGWSSNGSFAIPGSGHAQTRILQVSPGFFATMHVKVIAGRELEARDVAVEEPSALVVNEAFARTYFPGESAVGQRLERERRGQTVRYEIVGVSRNARDGDVRGAVGPYVYEPTPDPQGALQIRTRLDLPTLTARVRELLPRVHPSLRLTDVTLQSSLVGNAMLRERLLAVLSGFFALVGLVLAAVGLYGVSSYAVVRRTREIGIRLALGARPVAVVRSVLGSVGVAALIGAAGGVAAGLFFSRFVRTLLFETQPLDPWSLAVPAAGLMLVVIIAASRPAHRAARIDPVVALRAD